MYLHTDTQCACMHCVLVHVLPSQLPWLAFFVNQCKHQCYGDVRRPAPDDMLHLMCMHKQWLALRSLTQHNNMMTTTHISACHVTHWEISALTSSRYADMKLKTCCLAELFNWAPNKAMARAFWAKYSDPISSAWIISRSRKSSKSTPEFSL